MNVINCEYCDKEIPEDSLLCPYCGRKFTKFQNLVRIQKAKQERMMRTNKMKLKLMKGAFKPVKLQMSNMGQSKHFYEETKRGSKSKSIIYLLVFSIFITFIIVLAIVFGSIV